MRFPKSYFFAPSAQKGPLKSPKVAGNSKPYAGNSIFKMLMQGKEKVCSRGTGTRTTRRRGTRGASPTARAASGCGLTALGCVVTALGCVVTAGLPSGEATLRSEIKVWEPIIISHDFGLFLGFAVLFAGL